MRIFSISTRTINPSRVYDLPITPLSLALWLLALWISLVLGPLWLSLLDYYNMFLYKVCLKITPTQNPNYYNSCAQCPKLCDNQLWILH